MSEVGQREKKTQQRLVRLFRDKLEYRYLGDWTEREGNSNVEENLLRAWLAKRNVSEALVTKVLREVNKARALGGSTTLYDANQAVYTLLRYGVQVRPAPGKNKISVPLIDWKHPERNDFAIAEEVTIAGVHDKRPDIVLHVNGIALGVIELKRSTVSVAEGIRQNLDNQKAKFIRPFFSTVQLVMAGNDTEGLRYGVIHTPEKYFLTWKEPSRVANPLDRAIRQLCGKERLLEIIHDFIAFDAGIKKICRHNQYFGVRAAQESVKKCEGGIIWHTQGSGKSLTMIWLAKWIREHVKNARVLIITDRTELDSQIEKFFKGVSEDIYRTKSGADLVSRLNTNEEWLLCSLIHKFGVADEGDVDSYLDEIRKALPKGFRPKGELFVFVDECHRTQSGKLHAAMKELLPGAMLIGFTGTPLLKKDKRKSIEVFGPYIHTYKYDEAVADGVVLDLRYEARDIDQHLTSQKKVDQWFEVKTRGLTDIGKAQLKKRWGTLQKILSSRSRLEMIVADILMDMETKDRLQSGHGNAMLVTSSIYAACQVFEMLQRTHLKGKCAIVTSYKPSPSDVKGQDAGEGMPEKLRQYEIYRKMLAAHFNEDEDRAVRKVERFEEEVKKRFIEQPGQMKLLIVVDKLLTGFDAPPATYLYIDKQMQDHGLFQAICRVNRLHTEDKEYGYVIDYKDLFKSLARSMHDYTGEAFDGFDEEDVAGLLKDRVQAGKERLEETLESVRALCEPVEPPRDTQAYMRYFCGTETADGEALEDSEPRRVALYKLVGSLLRAYANLAGEMDKAGYSAAQTEEIKQEVTHYEKVRGEVKLGSGDYVDMKMFEPAMRHLLDTYIRAEESEAISAFDDMTLVDLLVSKGVAAVEALPKSVRRNREASAEVIENNIRRVIIDERAVNPRYFDRMSQLLDGLIQARRQGALDYKAYLEKITALAKGVRHPEKDTTYPSEIESPAQRALYDNLDRDIKRAILVDEAIRAVRKAGWRGNVMKTKEVRRAIKKVLGNDEELVETVLELAKNQHEY